MSKNKRVVQHYMESYTKLDHDGILSCLTEDVEWILPGAFHVKGKAAFDKEIENDAFNGKPEITVNRMTEENDVVAAEGRVRCRKTNGGMLDAMFCDLFEMKDGKIKRLTSYLGVLE